MYRDGHFAIVDGGYFCTCEYAGNHFLDMVWYNVNYETLSLSNNLTISLVAVPPQNKTIWLQSVSNLRGKIVTYSLCS
jgi:hypothetical protein